MGGFAHSDGLEALAADGVVGGPGELEAVLAAHLRLTLSRSDARFVRAAHRAVRGDDLAALRDSALGDLTSRASLLQRRSTQGMGRNLLRVGRAIASPEESTALDRVGRTLGDVTPRASVFGALACVLGIGESDAGQGHVHAVLAGAVAASVRLALVPPLEGQAVLRRLLAIRDESQEAGWSAFSPLLDIASMRHELADGRLFAS